MNEEKEKAIQTIAEITADLIECDGVDVTCTIVEQGNSKFIEMTITGIAN